MSLGKVQAKRPHTISHTVMEGEVMTSQTQIFSQIPGELRPHNYGFEEQSAR